MKNDKDFTRQEMGGSETTSWSQPCRGFEGIAHFVSEPVVPPKQGL
jgi:hypothetical protein